MDTNFCVIEAMREEIFDIVLHFSFFTSHIPTHMAHLKNFATLGGKP
jgi:hypothetical protein